MSIRLIRLSLENFKGTQSFVFEPDGQNVTVLGSNGVGKTTLFDAYNWLLFGKDSAGRSDSAFDVKPYGAELPVCVVTGEFDAGADGLVTLQRQLAEKIVRQRGTDETSIKNDYSFHINGVPKIKTQYDQFISELCPPQHFRMVSDPDYFAGKMKWDERRRVLIELFGGVDESELMASGDEWTPLAEAAAGNSVADYKAILTAERKKVRAELDMIPALISEAEKAIPTEVREFDPLDIEACEKDLADAERHRASVADGTAIADLRLKLADAESDLVKAETAYINSGAFKAQSEEVSKAERERCSASEALMKAEDDLARTEKRLADVNDRLSQLREEYKKLNALSMPAGSDICPHCRQQLPPERVEEIRAEFNRSKSERLEANIAAGKSAKIEADRLASDCMALEADVKGAAERLDAAEAKCTEVMEARSSVTAYRDTEEYALKRALIDSIKAEIENARASVNERLSKADAEVDELKRKLADLREVAAQQATAVRQRRRMEELKDRGRELGKRAAELDRLLDMCSRFEQHKLTAIEDSVNSRFKYARFKLFDHQLNGGWSECCEVVVDGAPYSTNLNPGKKINAGLDIVSVLSDVIKFSAPVWIDNAESYVSIMDIDAQVIRLQVDSSASELTVIQ